MKNKLDKAWEAYKRRQRLQVWMNTYYGYLIHNKTPTNSRLKFEQYARKVWRRKEIRFEWFADGSCCIEGVMLFLPDA